jgi:hypothetical protein
VDRAADALAGIGAPFDAALRVVVRDETALAYDMCVDAKNLDFPL